MRPPAVVLAVALAVLATPASASGGKFFEAVLAGPSVGNPLGHTVFATFEVPGDLARFRVQVDVRVTGASSQVSFSLTVREAGGAWTQIYGSGLGTWACLSPPAASCTIENIRDGEFERGDGRWELSHAGATTGTYVVSAYGA